MLPTGFLVVLAELEEGSSAGGVGWTMLDGKRPVPVLAVVSAVLVVSVGCVVSSGIVGWIALPRLPVPPTTVVLVFDDDSLLGGVGTTVSEDGADADGWLGDEIVGSLLVVSVVVSVDVVGCTVIEGRPPVLPRNPPFGGGGEGAGSCEDESTGDSTGGVVVVVAVVLGGIRTVVSSSEVVGSCEVDVVVIVLLPNETCRLMCLG